MRLIKRPDSQIINRIHIVTVVMLIVLTLVVWASRNLFYYAYQLDRIFKRAGNLATNKIIEAISLAAIGLVFLRVMIGGGYQYA